MAENRLTNAERQKLFRMRKRRSSGEDNTDRIKKIRKHQNEDISAMRGSVNEKLNIAGPSDRTNEFSMNWESINGERNATAYVSNNVSLCEEYDSGDEESIAIETSFACAEASNVIFQQMFNDNDFGYACSVCDRLWFKNDLRAITEVSMLKLLENEFPEQRVSEFLLCSTCRQTVNRNVIPSMSISNGFKYPEKPINLPTLDPISERLVSPRLPFMQIRRLRYGYGSQKIVGQIINIPVNVEKMVTQLPRNLADDQTINVNIKKNLMHKSTYLSGMVQISTIREWTKYLIETPLYKMYHITVRNNFLNEVCNTTDDANQMDLETLNETNEHDLLISQQHTLLWNENYSLNIAPAQNAVPLSIIYDTHAEELSFPSIYYGCPRMFKPGVHVTPFMIASSELRRKDRRGAKPNHVLYMSMKILRLRVSQALTSNFRCLGDTSQITRQMIEDKKFLEFCIEKNLCFLKSIPNSIEYWAGRKKDLFALIRQLGKPTFFLTISANEVRWSNLLKILHRLSTDHEDHMLNDPIAELTSFQKTCLVSDDPMTCCVYFNKLVNVILTLLRLKNEKTNPLGKYRVCDYFKRIEFQHRGSPHAHILLWLENFPHEELSENMPMTIDVINKLCSVSKNDLPLFYENQVHRHTFTCFKKSEKKCRFNIPYWPMKQTRILFPINKEDGRKEVLRQKGLVIQKKLETIKYESIEDFFVDNDLDEDRYLIIIRSVITRPMVIFGRNMQEIWTNTFNPWIANTLNSNIDFQFILDEYSCAAYCVEYVNKCNRGLSDLHRELILLQDQFPDQDYEGLLKKLSINLLNSVEMSAQEGAWYLLRQPMSDSSRYIVFIPTMWPHERIKSHKKKKQMDDEQIDQASTDVWTRNIIEKYENRRDLEDICLADFASLYTEIREKKNQYRKREQRRVIRYRDYDVTEINEYKREMVLLYVPFKNEHVDILDRNIFLKLYEDNEKYILEKRREYESDLDLEKTIEIVKNMCDNERIELDIKQETFKNSLEMNIANMDDINFITTDMMSVVKERCCVMNKYEYCKQIREMNEEQKELILHNIHGIHKSSTDRVPIQIFLTGPAGCGKSYTLRVLMETYNRFTESLKSNINAYIACASTGKAAVAINGTTVHSAFRLTLSKRKNSENTLAQDKLYIYRSIFATVKIVIIDEISMIGADLLQRLHSRLCEISGNFHLPFGGMDIIFTGDLRQLPPVNARAIFKPPKDSFCGSVLWQQLQFYPLTTVVRQTDILFSTILTKIGNGDALLVDEIDMINSRFRTIEYCKTHFPDAIRLFHRNIDVDKYNIESCSLPNAMDCIAEDTFSNYKNDEQLINSRTKIYKMSTTETGGLSYIVKLVPQKPYLITTNVDVQDGLVNGTIGKLMHIEMENGDITRLWLQFDTTSIGSKQRIKCNHMFISEPTLKKCWTPIMKRTANITLNSRVKCRRIQFPLVPATAITIHKSQGATFEQIIFDYNRNQDQQLVYVALSRVTSIDGLYITNKDNDHHFYHVNKSNSPKIREIQSELQRLSNHPLRTISDDIREFISQDKNALIALLFNVQSLNAHKIDIENDSVLQSAHLLLLTETWLRNEDILKINGYELIIQSRRPNVTAGGVAIYQQEHSKLTFPIQTSSQTKGRYNSRDESVGDICSIEFAFNDTIILLFCVYFPPNTSYTNIMSFLKQYLPCSNSFTQPIILAGDFNINIQKPENKKVLGLMYDEFQLTLASNKLNPTTLGGSTIDLVFTKNVTTSCKEFISYFSYHRPIFIRLS